MLTGLKCVFVDCSSSRGLKIQAEAQTDGQKNTVLHSERTRAGGNKQKGKNVFGGVEVRGGFHTVHAVGDI